MRTRALWLLGTFLVMACPPDPTHPALETMIRWWSFNKFMYGAVGEARLGDERGQVGGAVNETIDFGPMVLFPHLAGPNAKADVFSTNTGATYWVSAQAPSAVLRAGATIGNSAQLSQYQYFRKTTAQATLQLVVTKTFMEAIDENGGVPTELECPWHRPGGNYFDCKKVMTAWVDFDVTAYSFSDQTTFLKTGGFAELLGFGNDWAQDAYTHGDATVPFWNNASFGFEQDVEGDGGGHSALYLASPITINVPLASVPVGELFYVYVGAKAATVNHRQRETYLSAYFRDPETFDGLGLTYEGLEPMETPMERPAAIAASPAPPCASLDPQAGTLQFESAAFADPELPGDGATVIVTRSGGSRGAVSALLTTSDGTAAGGVDYTPITTLVLFADGEMGSRAVRIPLVVDADVEPDKTVNLTLSAPMGCATLGDPSTAVLTIMDDDRPIVATGFTVGGTVTGMTGTGLVLLEARTGMEVTPANGPFSFGGAGRPDGFEYEVRVMSQPVNPIQVCTVTNGTGTIAGANVTDVVVACVTPEGNGALDPGFGDGGKATMGLLGGATAMALQPDGKIVLVGGLSLARYDTDGSLDESFGTSGVVAVVFNGGLLDVAQGVAVQPDGKIVVVGVTRVGAQEDFAVARYTSTGAPDPGFGTGGKVSTDFGGSFDSAWAVRIQTDGNIVVAGHAAVSSPLGLNNDFAVARYTSTGAPDMGFGTGGKVTTNIAGRTDLAYAAVLQTDGKIVVAGRVADGGGSDPDVGLVRYNTDGSPDMGFGSLGIVQTDLHLGNWEEAADLVLQPDGKIVVAGQGVVGPNFNFAVARFSADGMLDGGFGSAGVATAALSSHNDYARAVALQADGKIVVVGQTSNLVEPNFGIARFDAAGAPDRSFGTDGTLTVDFFGASDGVECVAVQPDGKIVVAGFARNGAATGLGLARVLP